MAAESSFNNYRPAAAAMVKTLAIEKQSDESPSRGPATQITLVSSRSLTLDNRDFSQLNARPRQPNIESDENRSSKFPKQIH